MVTQFIYHIKEWYLYPKSSKKSWQTLSKGEEKGIIMKFQFSKDYPYCRVRIDENIERMGEYLQTSLEATTEDQAKDHGSLI